MKSRLLFGIAIVGMIFVTGCSNDEDVVNGNNISNSNSIENREVISENDNLESNKEVVKNNVKEDTTVVPSGNEETKVKQQDNNYIKIENISVGAYIKYQPSSTSCAVLAEDSGDDKKQIYNPSNITSWKVFKNNNGQLDIISSESVGDLTLKGATGYAKAVDTLNKMCQAYVNPRYADNGRCLGYIEGNSMGIVDTNKYPLTWEYIKSQESTGFPYMDDCYVDDRTIINTIIDGEYPLHHSSGHVWLASRRLGTIQEYVGFFVRNLYNNGSYKNQYLYDWSSDGTGASYSYTSGVRPVISL